LGKSVKDVACRLNDVEHSMIGHAATTCETTIENFLVESGLRLARAMGVSSPYRFAGQLYVTHGLPDVWYEATSEDELITHLKAALRDRDIESAGAMAVELLDFPTGWDELDLKERSFQSHWGVLRHVDPELAGLVNSAFGRRSLSKDSSAWDCYKAILHSTARSGPPGMRQAPASA
jgi:hypothetical protein